MKEIEVFEEYGYVAEAFAALVEKVDHLERLNRNYLILIRDFEKKENELEDELQQHLRDCHDLLNDCGFFYEDGTWVDGDNREGEE